jgi:hypothetical protein
MTDTPKGSDPAFPVPGHFFNKGIPMRDYFAAHALIGLIVCEGTYGGWGKATAADAYEMADCMLAAREPS